MENIKEKEEIIRTQYWLDGIDEKVHDQVIEGFFRTQEKKVAIFLKARGYPVRGLEKKMIRVSGNHKKKILAFCFDSCVRSAFLELYNYDDPKHFNVNAKRMLDATQDISSMIINF